MHLSNEQFERQQNYEASLLLICKIHDSGLISSEEFLMMKSRIIDKYSPIIQH